MDSLPVLSPNLQRPDLHAALSHLKKTDTERQKKEAAVGFESVFASTLLKEMRSSLEPGILFGQDSGDIFGGLFDMFLGKHIAESGSLGIAKMVSRYLESR